MCLSDIIIWLIELNTTPSTYAGNSAWVANNLLPNFAGMIPVWDFLWVFQKLLQWTKIKTQLHAIYTPC